jgi:N-acetylglucosaminyl-diphospho-decaprenol L-rhamnosyltransferase
MTPRPSLSLSIVSHGQGTLIRPLLDDILRLCVCTPGLDEILLTLNIPEDESFAQAFPDLPLKVLRNAAPKGFGANHNAAFGESRGDLFIVVNPDIRLTELPTEPMIAMLAGGAGAWAPVVATSAGRIEDSARRFPTFGRLARRVLLRQRAPDYRLDQGPVPVDWVAGMFMAFPRSIYAALGGFDERYFMYMEDADICRRMHRLLHRDVIFDPRVQIIHDAQRASRRSGQHLRWHLRSALRFLIQG